MLRKIQCLVLRRAAQQRNILQLKGGPNPDREIARSLQHLHVEVLIAP